MLSTWFSSRRPVVLRVLMLVAFALLALASVSAQGGDSPIPEMIVGGMSTLGIGAQTFPNQVAFLTITMTAPIYDLLPLLAYVRIRDGYDDEKAVRPWVIFETLDIAVDGLIAAPSGAYGASVYTLRYAATRQSTRPQGFTSWQKLAAGPGVVLYSGGQTGFTLNGASTGGLGYSWERIGLGVYAEFIAGIHFLPGGGNAFYSGLAGGLTWTIRGAIPRRYVLDAPSDSD